MVNSKRNSANALLALLAAGAFFVPHAWAQNSAPNSAARKPAPPAAAVAPTDDVPEFPVESQPSEEILPLLPEENTPANAQANSQANAPVNVVSEDEKIPVPEVRELAAPQTALPRPSAKPGENAPAMPEAAQGGEFDENLFFDAEQLVPESELAKKGAPSKVNPRLSPGSALVITTTDRKANSQDAQLVAAERAMSLGRYESALEMYDALYAKNARDPNILFGRASALQKIGRDEEAIAAYEELLNLRPKNLEAQINMQGLIGKRYPAVALRALNDLYETNSGNTALVSQIAVMQAKVGNVDEAVRFLGIAASLEPQNATHVFNMAVISDRAGDRKAALKYYEEALEVDALYGGSRSIPRETVYQRLAEIR